MKLVLRCLTLALLAGLGSGGQAQTVYRCGNEYTRVPCKNGKPIDIDNGAVSTPQAVEARRVAERERRLGNDMERDRLRRDAALKPARAGSLSPAKPPEPAASANSKPKKRAKAKTRVESEKDFVAKVPKAKAGR